MITRRVVNEGAHAYARSRQRPFMCTAFGIQSSSQQVFFKSDKKQSLNRTWKDQFQVRTPLFPCSLSPTILLLLFMRAHCSATVQKATLPLSRAGLPAGSIETPFSLTSFSKMTLRRPIHIISSCDQQLTCVFYISYKCNWMLCLMIALFFLTLNVS